MSSSKIGKVGKKGELYPPKSLREKLGLSPESKVCYSISPKGELVVKMIPSASELLKRKRLAFVRIEEIEELSEEMQRSLGNKINEGVS